MNEDPSKAIDLWLGPASEFLPTPPSGRWQPTRSGQRYAAGELREITLLNFLYAGN
jgi:hypothetical protein